MDKGKVAAAVLAASMVGCTAHQQPSRVETALANMAKDVVIPLEAEKLKSPLKRGEEGIQEGREIYAQSCALCHGAEGHAATDLGRAMYPPAMDLTSPHVQHWSDAQLFWIIQNGVRLTGMPSWKSSLSEADTWELINYIRTLPNAPRVAAAPESGPAASKSEAELIAYGKTLYRQEGCFTCHLLNGEGGQVGPDLSAEGTRGRSPEWITGHFKNPPAYTKGSVMPAYDNLTDEQLRALTVFLQNQKARTP